MPSASVQYRYSASGQLIGQTGQGTTTLAGAQSYRYDATERLLGTDSPLGQLGYSYDSAGNPTQRSAANAQASAGTSGHQYDAAGRLAQVTAPDGKQTTYSYDAAGRRVSTEPSPVARPRAARTPPGPRATRSSVR